jgi:hypothetical protein
VVLSRVAGTPVREADAEYTEARSAEARPLTSGRDVELKMPDGRPGASPSGIVAFAESMESGRDSRLLPKREDGARARTEASVSRLCRRRRLDDEASVRMEALSVRMLFAVAAW